MAAAERVGFGPFAYVPRSAQEAAAQRITFSDPYRAGERTMVQPEVSSASTVAVPTARRTNKPIDPILAPVQPPPPKGEFSSDGLGSTIALSVLVGLLIAALMAAGIVALGML